MRVLRPLSYLAATARLAGALVSLWPLALIALLFVSPTGPHVLWEYEYRNGLRPSYAAPRERIYVRCTYLGARGLVTPDLAPQCPFVAFLNADDWRKP